MEEVCFLLNILRYVFGAIVIVLAGYSVIIGNYALMPYIILSLGAMLLVIGLSEFQKEKRLFAYVYFAISAFNILAAILDIFFVK